VSNSPCYLYKGQCVKIVLLLVLLIFPVNDIVDTPVAARYFRRLVKDMNSILRDVQLVQY